MKKILPFIVSLFVACGLYYFYAQTPSQQTKSAPSHTLIVGISPDFPPYAQVDLETGQIVGLEVDVIKEIAQRLGKTLQIKDMPFNSLIIELITGKIDVIAAGLTPTEERKKMILFSHSYVDNDSNLIVTKKTHPTITQLQDVYGKTVAVNIGYTADSFLSNYPEIQLIRLKSPSDGFMALKTNRVEAFAIAQSVFNKFEASQEKDHGFQIFVIPSSADACALAYKKTNTQLQQQIDPIIDAMIADGTMQIIKNRWNIA